MHEGKRVHPACTRARSLSLSLSRIPHAPGLARSLSLSLAYRMHQGSHGVKVPHGRAPMQCRQSVLVCCLCGRPCQLPVSWRTPVTVVGALRKHLCARGRGGGQGSCESADAKQQAGAGTAADAGAGQGDRTGQKDKKSQKDKKGTNGTNGTNGTPWSKRALTVAWCPRSAALMSGVLPLPSRASTLAPSRSNSRLVQIPTRDRVTRDSAQAAQRSNTTPRQKDTAGRA